jgi:hypothetical protein
MEEETANKLICHNCVGDLYLSNQIEETGDVAECSYCGTTDVLTCSLERVADVIEPVFEHSWRLTANQPDGYEYALMRDPESTYGWDRSGMSPADVVEEVGQVSRDVAEDIVSLLDSRTIADPRDPDFEAPFGSEARYDPVADDDSDGVWAEMRRELHHRARFFNQSLTEFLNEIFAGIHSVKGPEGAAVRTLRAGGENAAVLFRARLALSEAAVEDVLVGIPASLGPPSGRKVRAGRMNAAGIAVFYGALDAETCLAEVRPPVGASVVMAKFELLRDVQLLDLQAMEKATHEVSYFHPDFVTLRRKTLFLRTLSSRCSAPVLPGGEEFDYLLTQAVCEYLASAVEPRLDGIAFRSAQRGGVGTNVTLFPRASLVANFDHPKGTNLRASHYSGPPDDCDQSIDIWVDLPKLPMGGRDEFDDIDLDPPDFVYIGPQDSDGLRELGRQPTLRLVVDALEVIEIGGVSYETSSLRVDFHEATKRNSDF